VRTVYLFFELSSRICLAPCLPWVRWNCFKYYIFFLLKERVSNVRIAGPQRALHCAYYTHMHAQRSTQTSQI